MDINDHQPQRVSQIEEAPMTAGSWLSALWHRSELRTYAAKINDGTITPDEVRDYIVKGGTLGEMESYDTAKNFFVGNLPVTILSKFIAGPRLHEAPLPPRRLESLDLLLRAGADPNVGTNPGLGGQETLPPVLIAAASNDLDALKLLVAHGADLKLVASAYLGTYGPPLMLVSDAAAAEFLIASGADLHAIDEDGESLLHLAIRRRVPADEMLQQVDWMLAKGLSPKLGDRRGRSALDRIRERIEAATPEDAPGLQAIEARMRRDL